MSPSVISASVNTLLTKRCSGALAAKRAAAAAAPAAARMEFRHCKSAEQRGEHEADRRGQARILHEGSAIGQGGEDRDGRRRGYKQQRAAEISGERAKECRQRKCANAGGAATGAFALAAFAFEPDEEA